MKKLMISGTLIFLLFFGGISLFSGSITSNTNSDPIQLGYCPTMSDLAEEIASKNSHISLQPFDYTTEALQSLNNGNVDMVLVGRLAKGNEVNHPFEKQLRQGLTLVGREKRLIHLSQLQNSRIHTYVNKELAQDYIPNPANVFFYETFDLAIEKGINEIVLINWSDYTDDLELVIPVDNAGNKIEQFRIPVIYSYDREYMEDLHPG